MPRPTATSAAKRTIQEQVVRTAMELFASHGYRGASLDMIAAELGVTRQALLYYFPSKVKLLLAVLDLRDQEDAVRVARLAAEHDWSIGDALTAIVRHFTEHPELARLHTVLAAEAVDPGHPAHAWFVERYRERRARIADAVAREQTRSRLDPLLEPETLAGVLLALLDGLQLQTLLEPGAVRNDRALTTVLKTLAGNAQ